MAETGAAGAGEAVVVADLATLRAISDPLRMRMIELMSRGDWTVKQVAAALGVSQTRLYRHVAILESHGLLRVTGTRLVSGIVEKRYAAPARLSVEPRLLGGGADQPGEVSQGVDALVGTAFTTVRREVARAIEARRGEVSDDETERERIFLTFDEAHLRKADAADFRRRLQDLVAEFESRKADRPAEARNADARNTDDRPAEARNADDESRYRLLVGFFRTVEP